MDKDWACVHLHFETLDEDSLEKTTLLTNNCHTHCSNGGVA
jgi:hypothetical protein